MMIQKKPSFAVALSLALSVGIARCEDTNALQIIEQLKQRIEQLERKVQTLEHGTTATTNGAVVSHQPTDGESHKLSDDDSRKNLPTLSIGEHGAVFASAGSNYVLHLGAVLQADTRTFFDDPGDRGNNGFVLRRARLYITGTILRDFDFDIVPEFGTSANGGNSGTVPSPQIFDASLTYRYSPGLQFTVGKFKVPVGLELLKPDRDTTFNERALASDLVPSRDLGFDVHGDLFDDTFSYAAGIFNGVGDARISSNSNLNNDKSFVGRLFVHPFRHLSLDALKGFGVGVAGSFEDIQGTNTASLPNTSGGSAPGYATVGQQQFFAYTNGVVAAGQHWRVSPQGYYYYGPFGLLGEYVISDQKVRLGKASPVYLDNTGWQITGTWVLTGEDAHFRGGVTPKFNFNPSEGTWGAWQLAARYSELNIDGAAFPKFADPRASAHGAREWSIGLNWYLSQNLRASASFSHTHFEGGGQSSSSSAPATVTRHDENVLFTRLQLAF